jgi:hypothetical protein
MARSLQGTTAGFAEPQPIAIEIHRCHDVDIEHVHSLNRMRLLEPIWRVCLAMACYANVERISCLDHEQWPQQLLWASNLRE